jgi:hypothetical protein
MLRVAVWLGALWLAGCSGALRSEGPADDGGADIADATTPPMCPAPADVRSGVPCAFAGLSCPSLESAWPPECGVGGGAGTTCFCAGGAWTCGHILIGCSDAGPPISDAAPPADVILDVDAAACPPPGDIHKDGPCTTSFLSCPSVENKIPACVGGYEPTTCHCLTRQWSCEFYGIPCPDAGRDAQDARPDAFDAFEVGIAETSPVPPCEASSCDASDDVAPETAP